MKAISGTTMVVALATLASANEPGHERRNRPVATIALPEESLPTSRASLHVAPPSSLRRISRPLLANAKTVPSVVTTMFGIRID